MGQAVREKAGAPLPRTLAPHPLRPSAALRNEQTSWPGTRAELKSDARSRACIELKLKSNQVIKVTATLVLTMW